MTSTPDTPNMTDAHVSLLASCWLSCAPHSSEQETFGDIESLVRSIHEGSVVPIDAKELKDAREIARIYKRAGYPFTETAFNQVIEYMDGWLSHTDTTDATTQEAKC